jgi:enoyl-CoA hydratase/carnithine racemase
MSTLSDGEELAPGLVWSIEGEIALLRIARPQKRNAVNEPMVLGIERFFRNLPPAARAVIIHGEGDHFSAGLDLSEVEEHDATEGIQHSRNWHRAFAELEFGRVPVIAVLHGAVIGGGLELAAACHIRVAERSAFYALPEGQRGIFVGGGGSVRLPRLIGAARMADMMLTGRTYGAEEGAVLGFSQYVVDNGAGMARGLELARKVAGNAALTNFAVLQALPRIANASPEIGLLTESLMASIAAADKDAKRRLNDFLEKRAAKVAPPA